MKRNHIVIYTPTSKDGDPNMDGTTYNNNNNVPHQEAMLIMQTPPRLFNFMHQSFVTTEPGAGWEIAGDLEKIRPKRTTKFGRNDPGPKRPGLKRLRAEMTQGRNDPGQCYSVP